VREKDQILIQNRIFSRYDSISRVLRSMGQQH
jgi:hypothetical protein